MQKQRTNKRTLTIIILTIFMAVAIFTGLLLQDANKVKTAMASPINYLDPYITIRQKVNGSVSTSTFIQESFQLNESNFDKTTITGTKIGNLEDPRYSKTLAQQMQAVRDAAENPATISQKSNLTLTISS